MQALIITDGIRRESLAAGMLAGMDKPDKSAPKNNLRAWREHRNMSQTDLAEAVGTTHGQIAHLETGRSQLSEKWLRKLADALDTTAGHLLDHDPKNMPTDILDIWFDATEDQRRQLSDMARIIVKKAG